jgi:large repetitive protein
MKKYYRLLIVCIGILFVIRLADAHSVGQVQTTKFFAPETIQLLENRISNGQPAGFVVGDILTYIIQFTPVANNANIGVAGYVTDYIPPGVEVVGADIVTLSGVDVNGADIYSPIAPQLPGGIDLGWGNQGANTYLAPFDSTATYDITGRCHALTLMNNCNGRLTELHADTGIFFSTDPRTAVYPALPQRIAQGTNGYKIQPTAAGQLNPIIGQPQATTHNLWDADQTNAFGSKQADIDNLTQPKSSAIDLTNGKGRGPAPYNAGSPVAGPQTGYTQDNTAGIGPWRRIYYPGSRIGDPTTGPATAALVSTTALGGLPTNLGVTLSTSNPLPAGTNAVRWAVGRLVVGQNSYVRIRLRITQPVPAGGLVNSSEVFGGDAGDGAAGGYNNDGQDNPWRYHVPSVADNNSNLYVKKIACVYSPTASTCTPLSGAYHPGATTITYQITYLNSGNVAQTNVALSDIVPCDTDAGMTAVVGTVTGPLAVLVTLPLSTSITNGTCASPPTRHTVTFPTIATLNPGEGGRVIINIPNNANVENKSVITRRV